MYGAKESCIMKTCNVMPSIFDDMYYDAVYTGASTGSMDGHIITRHLLWML